MKREYEFKTDDFHFVFDRRDNKTEFYCVNMLEEVRNDSTILTSHDYTVASQVSPELDGDTTYLPGENEDEDDATAYIREPEEQFQKRLANFRDFARKYGWKDTSRKMSIPWL